MMIRQQLWGRQLALLHRLMSRYLCAPNCKHELYLDSQVPVLDMPPAPLEFQRDWVSMNKPVLIKGVFEHWPALELWSQQYLRDKIGGHDVTVAVTPNGYADAVYQDKFVMPEERKMKFADFLDVLNGAKDDRNGIYYVQKQNSNFTDEFLDLMKDAAEDIPWATEALGKHPDAVNIWMGDERAITSLHKDHYENIYCVVRGEKQFILYPPTDQAFIPYELFSAAKYKEKEDGTFDIIDDMETGKVPWIPVDPLNPDLTKYPDFSRARAVCVKVQQGDTLYLPSLWYHHVRQSHGCIAVNFWYDMEYDVKYCYHKLVESLLDKIS